MISERFPVGVVVERVAAESRCDDLVEAVPMPRPVFDWLSAFVAAHHVERKEWRRKRDRADPEALAVRRDRPAKESPTKES